MSQKLSDGSSVQSQGLWGLERYRQHQSKYEPSPFQAGRFHPKGRAVADLPEYITNLSPNYMPPLHLAPMLDVLRRIVNGESVCCVIHTPPRHGKTETLLHSMPWILEQRPDWTIGYASYADNIAKSKSDVAKELAKASGIQLARDSMGEWRTFERGGALARGVGGGLTGFGLNFGIVDDPVKDREQAESKVYRDRVWSWFCDVFLTRIEPGGSVIINMARWHPDDLAGRVIRELGWPYICLPAIDAKGRALWPARWPVTELLKKRTNEYTWHSLYQGNPMSRGGKVFRGAWGYAQIPHDKPRRWGIGIDAAYSKKTSADHSVIVVMCKVGAYFYVHEVHRMQVGAPAFSAVLKAVQKRYPGAPTRWYASGTELGTSSFMSKEGAYVEHVQAKADKFVRAIPYSAAWNGGYVLLREGAEWLADYDKEHEVFTGVDDPEDDQVDAGVAAFDVLEGNLEYGERFEPGDSQRRI